MKSISNFCISIYHCSLMATGIYQSNLGLQICKFVSWEYLFISSQFAWLVNFTLQMVKFKVSTFSLNLMCLFSWQLILLRLNLKEKDEESLLQRNYRESWLFIFASWNRNRDILHIKCYMVVIENSLNLEHYSILHNHDITGNYIDVMTRLSHLNIRHLNISQMMEDSRLYSTWSYSFLSFNSKIKP